MPARPCMLAGYPHPSLPAVLRGFQSLLQLQGVLGGKDAVWLLVYARHTAARAAPKTAARDTAGRRRVPYRLMAC